MYITTTMPTKKPLIAKRTHKKSRNGCQQCKSRKVKCDERKPLCRNCEKHFDGLDECDFPILRNAPSNSWEFYPTPPARTPSSRLEERDASLPRQFHVPLPSPLGSGIDPFMAHPDSNVPEAQFLMRHYFSNFTSKTFPIVLGHETKPLIQSWWGWAGHDPVLFHATLHLSSFHLSALKGEEGKIPSNALLNRECIRLLRERVEHPTLGISDETIGSILFLTIVEFERGNLKMVRMHVEGLKRIVRLRGGLNAISANNTILGNMIFGITMTVMTEPQFPPENNEPKLFDRWGEAALAIIDPNAFELERLGVTASYARVIKEIIHMTKILTSDLPSDSEHNYCSEILSRLFYLRPPIEEGAMIVSISEAMRIATGILCLLPFKNDYPNPALMINVQLHKLKAALDVMFDLVPPGHELLPWLFGVGGLWSVEPERSWFVGHLITVADELDLKSYEEFRAYCVKVIWVDVFCDPTFRAVWEEVASKRDKYSMLDFDPW